MLKGMAIAVLSASATLVPVMLPSSASAAPLAPTTVIQLCNDTSTSQDFVVLGPNTGQIDVKLPGNSCVTGGGLVVSAVDQLTIQLQNFSHSCGYEGYIYEPCDFVTQDGHFVVIQNGKTGFAKDAPAIVNLNAANPTAVVDFQDVIG